MKNASKTLLFLLIYSCTICCAQEKKNADNKTTNVLEVLSDNSEESYPDPPAGFYGKLSENALSIIDESIEYDPSYFSISYPNGDVPKNKGVCTDVIIRTYRKLGIDLQKEVHEDMMSNFSIYPKIWGLKRTDTNIDHRRVPNLQKFFSRKGESLAVSDKGNDYKAGDMVTWMIGGKLPHIGIVTHIKNEKGSRPLIVHNIGGGQVLEDCLFKYKITGHYRYKK